MEYFAVFELKSRPGQLVVTLSHPLISEAGTVVAAPLFDAERFPIASTLNPIFELGGRSLALATEQLAAIPLKELGQKITTLEVYEYPIANAINRIFFGI